MNDNAPQQKDSESRNQGSPIQVFDASGLMIMIWYIGWLFTVSFAHLKLVKAFLAIFIWPFYLGRAF